MSPTFDFIKNVYRGKTIARILFNRLVYEHCRCLSGSVLDLAGGHNASYYRYLPKNILVTKTDYKPGSDVDMAVDITQPMPFKDASFDNAFLFHAIYIVENQLELVKDIRRITKPNGSVFISSPFLMNEMPEPHDFKRLTKEGLELLFKQAGFSSYKIIPFGNRFTVCANLLHPFFLFNTVRLIAYSLSMVCDKLVPRSLEKRHGTPIGYFCILKP